MWEEIWGALNWWVWLTGLECGFRASSQNTEYGNYAEDTPTDTKPKRNPHLPLNIEGQPVSSVSFLRYLRVYIHPISRFTLLFFFNTDFLCFFFVMSSCCKSTLIGGAPLNWHCLARTSRRSKSQWAL